MDDKNLRAYMAEMIGTFALVFISAGAVFADQLGQFQVGAAGVALATGCIYAGALAVTLPIAGGYLNPAVTIMLYVFKRLDGVKTMGLIFVQVLGAALAGLAVCSLFSFQEAWLKNSHLGTPQFNEEAFGYGVNGSVFVPLLKGIGVEFVLTFLLVFTIFGTLLDPRVPQWGGAWVSRLACLWVGLVQAAVTLVGYGVTGGSVNPARWFGLALWDRVYYAGAFDHNAVYWVGPIAGALAAGWIYTAWILPAQEESQVGLSSTSTAGGKPAKVTSTLFRAKK